jgi:RNA polymerase sigma factor (sigma-70 family)
MGPNENDKTLIRKAQEGDKAAFAKLIRRYEDRLFNTAFRLMGEEPAAEDVVQETFIKAFESLGSFKGDSQFFTWLYRIMYNVAISIKRKAQNAQPATEADIAKAQWASPEASKAKLLEGLTDYQLVCAALTGLDIGFDVLMKRYGDELRRIIAELASDPGKRSGILDRVKKTAHNSLHTYTIDTPFISWLYRIARETLEAC